MGKEKEILEIEKIKALLEYHFQKYKDYNYDSKGASKKKTESERQYDYSCQLLAGKSTQLTYIECDTRRKPVSV